LEEILAGSRIFVSSGESLAWRSGASSLALSIDPDTAEILGPGWFEATTLHGEMTKLPTDFNITFDEKHVLRTEVRLLLTSPSTLNP